MSVLDTVARNAWLLGISRDVETFLALKSRSKKVSGGGSYDRLSLRGLNRPILCRPGTTDIPVVWELFHNREYDFVGGWPFKTVVDCGANVGIFMAWVLRTSGHAIERYVGIEPDVDSFRLLKEQARSLGIEERATLLHAAVWDRDGTVAFNENGPSWSHHVAEGGGRQVRAVTLGTILDEGGLQSCDLLKLDIEGGEQQVLSSLSAHAHRIDAIVTELHGTLDYEWFAATVSRAGFLPAPPGRLFNQHPGAVRRGSKLERFLPSS